MVTGRWIILAGTILVIALFGCTKRENVSSQAGTVPAETQIADQPSKLPVTLSGAEPTSGQTLRFTGNNSFTAIDENGDGLNEALVVTVEVQAPSSGQYAVSGYLQKEGAVVANRPVFESALDSRASFENGPGTHQVDISFSGEQIYRSGEDGPYDLFLTVVGPNKTFARETFATPALVHSQYGEIPFRLTGASDSALDTDNNGDFDVVNFAVGIQVRVPGAFSLQAAFASKESTIATTSGNFDLGAGMHTVDLQFPASALRRAGEDGPYEATVNLIDASGHTLGGIAFMTRAYQANAFSPEG